MYWRVEAGKKPKALQQAAHRLGGKRKAGAGMRITLVTPTPATIL